MVKDGVGTAQSRNPSDSRFSLFRQIAIAQAEACQAAEAKQTIELMRSNVKESHLNFLEMTLESVAARLLEQNKVAEAISILPLIRNSQIQERVKSLVAVAHARAGDFDKAIELTAGINDPVSLANAVGGTPIVLEGIAGLLAEARRIGDAQAILRKTLANVIATPPDKTPIGSGSPRAVRRLT